MKKIIALITSVILLCILPGALAEENRLAPLFATVGEARAYDAEGRVVEGGEDGQYFVINKKDGKNYRNVANYDETLNRLMDELYGLDYNAEDFFDLHEAAMKAVNDYISTLPIAYSEEYTAQPLTEEEMTSRVGKKLGQLIEEGFEIGSNGTEAGEGENEMIISYSMRFGVFDYRCVVDADFDAYISAQENGTESDLVVKDMTLLGITEMGYEKRFHTDGTVDEPVDPFAETVEIMTEFNSLIEKALAGESVDIESFAEEMKEKYPDYVDMIDFYVLMYQTYGAEGLASMLNSAE